MKTLLKILGIIWALPVTLPMFLLHLPLWAFGQLRLVEWDDVALCFTTRPESLFHEIVSSRWNGYSCGNLIVYDFYRYPTHPESRLRLHELEHTRQVMRLGIFQPIIYALACIGIYFGSRISHPYHDNPFEIAARRAAGQSLDRGTRKHRWKLGWSA